MGRRDVHLRPGDRLPPDASRPGAWGEADGRDSGAFGRRDLLLIAAALALAAAVRVYFSFGIFSPDEMNTLRNAAGWWTGRFEMKDALFLHDTRPLMFVPVAWSFGAFGVSEITAVLWPFLASLGVVACVYLIALRLFGRETALYAVFFAVFFPLLAREGSRLLPGAVMNLCIALCALCYVVSEGAEKRRGAWLVLSGMAFGAIQAAGELGIVLGLFFVAAMLVWRWHGFWSYWPVAAGFLGVTAVIALYYWIATGNPLFKLDLSKQVYAQVMTAAPRQPLFYSKVILAPFAGGGGVFYVAGIGGAAALFQKRREALLVALWIAITWLLLEFGSVSLSEYQQLSKEVRYFSVVSVPTVVLAGYGMAWIRRAASRFRGGGRGSGFSAGSVVLVAAVVVVVSTWTLQLLKNHMEVQRANMARLRDHVRQYQGKPIYVTHWYWNTEVGFFLAFEDDYYPSGYHPYRAVNLATADSTSMNRYVQTLKPGERIGPGLVLHDERLFDASLGRTQSWYVGRGEIPELLPSLVEPWRLVDRLVISDRFVLMLYEVPEGAAWPETDPR